MTEKNAPFHLPDVEWDINDKESLKQATANQMFWLLLTWKYTAGHCGFELTYADVKEMLEAIIVAYDDENERERREQGD